MRLGECGRGWGEARGECGRGFGLIVTHVRGSVTSNEWDSGEGEASLRVAGPDPVGRALAAWRTRQEQPRARCVHTHTHAYHAPLLSTQAAHSPAPADFQYQRAAPGTKIPHIPGPNATIDGETHSGYTALFLKLWPMVQAGVKQSVVDPNTPLLGGGAFGVNRVVVAGHSMGAGVAALLAYAVRAVN